MEWDTAAAHAIANGSNVKLSIQALKKKYHIIKELIKSIFYCLLIRLNSSKKYYLIILIMIIFFLISFITNIIGPLIPDIIKVLT